MANNEYVNKVQFGDTTIMDISDTTAESNDVIEGEVFYTKSGARSTGTLGDATQSTHGLMSTTDKTKLDNIDEMIGATSSVNGTGGLVPTPTTTDVDKFLSGDGTWKDGGKPMVILSYGSSTWQDFINAYNNHVIVYCRASSNSNPASGSQTRMAFMAYVNDATNPTNVEFQYYRSMSSHSATAMGDEVYVYKLTSSNGGTWSVTVRKASIKEIAVASGSKLGVSWSSDKVTLSNTMTADDMPMSVSDNTTAKAAIEAKYTKPSGGIPSTDLAETYLTSHQDISGKADKVTGATSGNFASLDSNGNLTDSGKNASDFTVNVMTGASSSSAGASGLVPQPVVGDRIKFLCGDGTWKISPYMMYGVHYVEGDTNDTAGTWTGTLEDLTAYYNGLSIIYVPKVAGASTTTLNLNNIGAITCYTTNTTKLDTQYTANTPILFTYQDGYWRRADNDVNTTTISNLYHHYANYVADSAIYRYQILFERTEDKLTPLTNANNDTGTSKTMLTSVEFNAFGRIFYYVSATAVEANGSVSAGSLCFAHESFNARYTFNCGTTLTAHKNFYLVVTPTTGNMCTIASSSPWAQELPSTNDGNWYILIGRAYSTYQVSLYPLHPVYTYDGTKVIQVMPNGFTASSMIGATSSADGASGLVPKPVTGDNTKFLRGDGTWQPVSSGATIDDIAGSGDTDKAWSADKLITEFGTKADKTDTILDTTLSRGRRANSTVGTASFAFGNNVTASGSYSHAEGTGTYATGENSHAEGKCLNHTVVVNSTTYNSGATGAYSHTEGLGTAATSYSAHAEGSMSVASANSAHAEGYQTLASDQFAHAEGYSTLAQGQASHAEGNGTLASGTESHAEGYRSSSSITITSTTYATGATGNQSHSEGFDTAAIGQASHAEGSETAATGVYSHAEGSDTTASGSSSHAEGYTTFSRGVASHAEGKETFAIGAYAHAEGEATIGYGQASHVGGRFNVTDTYMDWDQWQANTTYAVDDKVRILEDGKNVGYICTTANSDAEFTVENWRKDERMNYAEIIGNGANNAGRSNARALTWEGDERLMGDVYVGCNADSTGGTKLEPVTATTVKTALGTTSGTTNFLREDGTWQNASPCICVKVTSISSLPVTVTCSAVKSTHYCIYSTVASSYVTGDWTITTSNGSFTISGSKASGTISTAYFVFYDVSGALTGTTS